MNTNLFDTLQERLGSGVKEQEPLAPYTTLKIGGPAEYFITVESGMALARAIQTAREVGIPFFVLGGGTNLLIADSGIPGLVIKNNARAITIRGAKGTHAQGVMQHGDVFVEAESGTPMNQLVRFTIEEGLSGLEMHLGLPGSVGGAVYMNSKWMRPTASYVGDAVYQATILTSDNTIQVVPQSYFRFGYDTSVLQTSGDILLSVVFALHPVSKETLWDRANETISYRRESQPQGVRTAGCTFRNISKAEALAASTPGLTTSAGFLIDHAGLKGARSGDAVISDMHANFIINTGHANAADVLELIRKAKSEVKRQFGVTLAEEIVIVGI